jgi:hypothetical protein
MRRLVVSLVLVACLVPTSFAAHKPGKRDEGQGVGQTVERAAKDVAKEAVDAVADELLDDKGRVTRTGPGGMPPGLAKKGTMPPGLEKQGKTPPGWSHGKKTGWSKDQPQQESLVRRIIRGIFRKKQEPASAPQPAQ